MKKGDIGEGVIERVDFPNKGMIVLDGQTILVKNGIPGQRVRFQIHKKRKNRLEGRLLEVLEPSPLETRAALCSLFPACGGCMYQTMDYGEQLRMKAGQIRALIDPVLTAAGQVTADGTPDYHFEGIQGSPREFAYRNKMEYSFGDACKDGPLTLGLHKKGSTYDVLTASDCQIVHEDFNRILLCVLDACRSLGISYYHKITHQGYLRHLLVRRSEADGEILVALVTSSQENRDLTFLAERICALPLEGHVTGVLHITNDSLADVVQSDKTVILRGQDYFYETILNLRFKITPFSFFQTNSSGAEVLYRTAREMIGDVRHATVYDLYSGTGTIAQILASVADKVIGVEIVEEAVAAARENAQQNGLENCTFLAGDVLKVLDEIDERPDYIVLDPPREGIHPKALPKILRYGVERMIYISCKPSSLARDLEVFLQNEYRVKRLCCVDMFPGTGPTECVTLLEKVTTAAY